MTVEIYGTLAVRPSRGSRVTSADGAALGGQSSSRKGRGPPLVVSTQSVKDTLQDAPGSKSSRCIANRQSCKSDRVSSGGRARSEALLSDRRHVGSHHPGEQSRDGSVSARGMACSAPTRFGVSGSAESDRGLRAVLLCVRSSTRSPRADGQPVILEHMLAAAHRLLWKE